VGLYFSSNIISIHVMEIFMYFIELFKDKKNRSILVTPLVMLVDPTMQNNRMSIKVMSLVNSRPLNVFAECPFSFQVADFASNFEDALMINSLARLQQNQLRITEKLNNIFAESFNTSNNNNTINTTSNSNSTRQRK